MLLVYYVIQFVLWNKWQKSLYMQSTWSKFTDAQITTKRNAQLHMHTQKETKRKIRTYKEFLHIWFFYVHFTYVKITNHPSETQFYLYKCSRVVFVCLLLWFSYENDLLQFNLFNKFRVNNKFLHPLLYLRLHHFIKIKITRKIHTNSQFCGQFALHKRKFQNSTNK